MANTPIQVIVQILTDTKSVALGAKELEKLGKVGEQAGQAIADGANRATTAQKKATAATKATVNSASKQAAATKNIAKGNKDAYVTTQQLAKENRFLANAWRDGSHVIDNRYLKSISGLRDGMKKFNKESQQTLVYHKGLLTTLDDGSQKWNRFLMKGNLVTRTLHNMSTNMVNMGKNAQWTGRQMMVGITLPIVGIGAAAVKSYLEIAKLDLGIKKLLQGTSGGSNLAASMKVLDDQSKKLATTMGITRVEVKSMQEEFASMGFDPNMIKQLTQIATEFEKLGNIDQSAATDMTRVLAQRNSAKGMSEEDNTKSIRDTLEKLNTIENKTALNTKDVVGEFSQIYPMFDQFNTSAPETIALLATFKQQGLDVSQGANSMKLALTKLMPAIAHLTDGSKDNGARLKALKSSLNAITKATGQSFDIWDKKKNKPRSAIQVLEEVGKAYGILKKQGTEAAQTQKVDLMRSLFGAENSNEGYAFLDALSASMDTATASGQDFAKAMSYVNDTTGKSASVWSKQLATYMGDPTVQFANKIEALKVQLQELGRMIVPPLTKIMDKIVKFVEKFSKLSDSTKKKILLIVAAMAALGPAVYIYGQALLFMGTIAKGLVTPFMKFFGLRSKYMDMAEGVNPLIEKLNELTGKYKETGDPKLLPQIKETMDELGKRPAIADAATASIEAQTAAQEALNTAEERGQDISLKGAQGQDIAVPESVAGLRKTSRETKKGLEAAEGFDPSVDAEVARRVERRKKEAVDREYKNLIDRDKGINADGSSRFKKRRIPRPDAVEKVSKSKTDRWFVDSLNDDAIDRMAKEEAEGILPGNGINAEKSASKRLRDLKKNYLEFDKNFGVPSPVRPNMDIANDKERLADFENRFNEFYDRLHTNISELPRGEKSLKEAILAFKSGSPEELHSLMKNSLKPPVDRPATTIQDSLDRGKETSWGPRGGKQERSLSRESIKNTVAEMRAASDAMGDGPQAYTPDFMSEVQNMMSAGPRKTYGEDFERRYYKGIQEAVRSGDTSKWMKSNAKNFQRGSKHSFEGMEDAFVQYFDSVEKSMLGKNSDQVIGKFKELDDLDARADKFKADGTASRARRSEKNLKALDKVSRLTKKVRKLEDGTDAKAAAEEELSKAKAALKDIQADYGGGRAKKRESIYQEINDLLGDKTDKNKNLMTPRQQISMRDDTATSEVMDRAFADNKAKGDQLLGNIFGKAKSPDLVEPDLSEMLDMVPDHELDPTAKNPKLDHKVRQGNVEKENKRRESHNKRVLKDAVKAASDLNEGKPPQSEFVKNWINAAYESGDPTDYAKRNGMPDEVKNALSEAVFNNTKKGHHISGMDGNKKGYRGLIRDAIGGAGPEENKGTYILEHLAADLMGVEGEEGFEQGIKGGSTAGRRKFLNRAAASQARIQGQTDFIPDFQGRLGQTLTKTGKGGGLEAIDKAIGEAGKTVDRSKSDLKSTKSKLRKLKAEKKKLKAELQSAIDQAIENERTRPRDTFGKTSEQIAAQRDAAMERAEQNVRSSFSERTGRLDTNIGSAENEIKVLTKKKDEAERAAQVLNDRAKKIHESGGKLPTERRKGKFVAAGPDSDMNVFDRAMTDSLDADGRKQIIHGADRAPKISSESIARKFNPELFEALDNGDSSISKIEAQLDEARKNKSGKKVIDGLEEKLRDEVKAHDLNTSRAKKAIKAAETKLAKTGYAKGQKAGTFIAPVVKKNLHELTGSLSPEMGNALHEMVVTNTVTSMKGFDAEMKKNSQYAIDVIKRYFPDTPPELQEAMAAKAYEVSEAIKNQMGEAQYFVGEQRGDDNLTTSEREKARAARGGRATTASPHVDAVTGNSHAEREAAAGINPLSFSEDINESARKSTGSGHSDSTQNMMDDLMTGFDRDKEEEVISTKKATTSLAATNERAIKQTWKNIDSAQADIKSSEAELQKARAKLAELAAMPYSPENDQAMKKAQVTAKAHESNRDSAKKSLNANRAKLSKLTSDDVTQKIESSLTPIIDEEQKGLKTRRSKADVAAKLIRDIDSEIEGITEQEVKESEKHNLRKKIKAGAAKRRLVKEREKAQKELDELLSEIDGSSETVYEVFNPDTKETEQYKSLDEYRKAKKVQAEGLVDALDMSDIEEEEKKNLLDELDRSAKRQEANAREVERKLTANRVNRRGFLDRWRKADEDKDRPVKRKKKDRWLDELEAVGENEAVDVADGPDNEPALPLIGGGNAKQGGFIKRAAAKVGKGAEKKAVAKKKGGLLNPANLVNMINPLKTVTTETGAAAEAVGEVGVAAETSGSSFAALFPSLSMLPELLAPLAPIAAVIAVIAAVVGVLALNFKKWEKPAAKGIKKIKAAFKDLIGAITGPFIGLWQRISGGSDKAGNKTGNMWKNVGKVLGRFFEIMAGVIKFVTPIVGAVMQVITKALYILVQVFRVIMAVFSGNWEDAWKGIQVIWDVIWWGIKKTFFNAFILIWKGCSMLVKGIVNALGKLFGAMKHIPGIGKHISGWSDAMKDFNASVDENTKRMSKNADNWIGTDPLKAKKKGKDAAKKHKEGAEEEGKKPAKIAPPEVPDGEAEDKGKEAVQKFMDAFQSQLQKVVEGWKTAAMSAFEDYSKSIIDGIDKRIKAIDDEVEAERKRSEDLEYLARKDELRAQRRASLLKYHAAYDSAVYEGKYDEAKQLTIDHQDEMDGIDKDEQQTDDDRQKQLTDRVRDENKKRLDIEKENAQKVLDLRKEQLQAQLDAMTEYIPKNVAEAQRMHEAIQGKMREFTNGYGQIGSDQAANWNKSWASAFAATRKQIAEEAYWSGDAAMKYFAAALGVELTPEASKSGEANGDSGGGDPGTFHGGWTDKNEYHTGGQVGPQNSNAHDIPATLQSGEFVVKRSTVKKLGTDTLHHINERAEVPEYHTGGYVSPNASKGQKAVSGNAMKKSFTKAKDLWAKGKAKLNFGGTKATVDDYKQALQNAASSSMAGMEGGEVAPGEYASGLNKEFVRRYQAWNAEMGGRFSIGSGFRTMAEQAVLYSRWLRHVPGQAKAAPPGKSNHNFGLAIDLSPSSTTAAQRAAGAKYGLRWPMGFEPWHVEPVEAKQWREQMRAGAALSTSSIGNGILKIRDGIVAGGTDGSTGGSSTSVEAGPIRRILKTIRTLESGGNYKAQSPYSTASGAYQFTKGTWGNYGGYPTAANAPANVQDARAASDVKRFLTSYHNDLRAVPGNWYNPSVYASGNWDQSMGKGNPLTMRKYIDRWMGMYNEITEYHKGGFVVPAMAKGGYVVGDGIAQVHAGETMLTKKLTDQLSNSNVGGDTYQFDLHFDGGFFGTDRDLEKLQLKLEQDIVPKIRQAQGMKKSTFKGVTK